MKPRAATQADRALALLGRRGMARSSEFAAAGVTAATVARLTKKGAIRKLGRGLYQLSGAAPGTHHSLAEAAKIVPQGIVCLVSALAFHELTDVLPARVWLAIGPKARRPRATHPPLEIVRFGKKTLGAGIERRRIAGVTVRIYGPAKTVVDMFRYRRPAGRRYRASPGLAMALGGLREALRRGKASPAEIARFARAAGVWRALEPYLDALIADA